jgi:hypothetical protein
MIEREDYTSGDSFEAEDRPMLITPVLPRAPAFPRPLARPAFRGLLGELIGAVEPHTEADPAALLIHALVAFGSVIGRQAYFVADGAKHYANLSAAIVAETSKGRKGTAWAHIRRCFTDVDQTWRFVTGLASGEGLIWHVRDGGPGSRNEPDLGVGDKRLMVIEPEFAKVLRILERDGSTLSAIIREAWDSGNLSTLTKNAPAIATGAHISVIGHITGQELRRYLTATEAGNGFGNRFLWVCAKRSKYLPEGGQPDPGKLADIARDVKFVTSQVKESGELRRNASAAERWRTVYPSLSDGRPGLLGSMTGRAEAQVMRLALVYALADAVREIELEHLEAALEVWRYCLDSARFIFGESLGDRVADDLRLALHDAGAVGLTRAEMSREVFGRNRSTREITDALALLHRLGYAVGESDRSGAGRPIERWFYRHEENDIRG